MTEGQEFGRANWPGVPGSRLLSVRAFPEGLEGLGARIEDLGRTQGKAIHAALRTRLPRAPGSLLTAGGRIDRAAVRRRRADGWQGHQDRVLGTEVADLPHAQEPQGAHDAAQR